MLSFLLQTALGNEFLFLHRMRYAKLFEVAKIHVQIMRFTCCLNRALNLSKPTLGLDLLGMTLQGKVLQP